MVKTNIVKRTNETNTIIQIIKNSNQYKENSENGLVILLNGEWGTGKSTFLEEIRSIIEKEEDIEIFNNYNAYEYDCYENAYIPFFATIADKIKIKDNFSEFIKSAGTGIGVGLKSALIPLAKGMLQNFTGIDIEKISQDLKDTLDLVQDDYLADFENFTKHKDEIKKKMNEICKDKKQIFIIDELDRCKPSFAMETLEIVKHFFDIENCVFIISVDKLQLEESAKAIYGNINSEKYFSKLFDYQFNLLPITFFDAVELEDEDSRELIVHASKVFSVLNISLRDGKKIYNELKNKNRGWSIYQSCCMLFFLILKYTDLSFYNAFINNEFSKYKDMIEQTYNKEFERYKRLFSIKIGNELNYGTILEEINYCLNKKYYDLEEGPHESTSVNNVIKDIPTIEAEVKKHVPMARYEGTIKENIKLSIR